LVPEPVDVDREPGDVAAERVPERVANGRVDLAGDFRDRQPIGDGDREVDREVRPGAAIRGVLAERDVDPGLAQAEPLLDSSDPTAGEAGHAVAPERGHAHDVDDGAPGHEGSAGCGVRRHAGGTSEGSGSGDVWRVPRNGCYHTAPLGPSRPSLLLESRSEDPYGPLLCDLRQGLDGRLQPAVVGHEPRPRPPPLPAEPPALHDDPERHDDEGHGLYALPPNGAEVREVAFAPERTF